jgi:hypothetical protein
MKKLAAIIAALFIPVASAQTSTTPNIVTNGYTNAYNTSNLNCWQPGDAYCSPNGQPYVNPGSGNINFSYGMWDLYQIRNVADVLPYGGTGLVVTGYHFQYTAKVGNNWDDASYDYLKSYVRIYGTGGQLIQSGDFTHTNTHDWYTFHLADSYNPLLTRFTKDNYTQVRFGFVGQDYNGWVGPYGPEIMNVSFTLNYQPDPCLRSQLISPQCPGFLDAVQKVGAIPKQDSPITQEAASAAITPATLVNAQENKKVDAPIAVARKAKEEVKFNAVQQEVAVVQDSTTQTQQTTTTATTEQTRTTQQRSTGTTRSTNQAQADTATSNSAYANESSQMEQMLAAPAKSVEPVQTATTTTSPQQREGPALQVVQQAPVLPDAPVQAQQVAEPQPVTTPVVVMRQPEPQAQTAPQIELAQPIQIEQPKVQVEVATTPSTPLYTPPNIQQLAQPIQQELTPVVIEQPVLAKSEAQVQEVNTALPTNMLTDKTNPVNDVVTAQPQMPTMAAFTGPAVNQKQQDNDLAGGVSLARMAVVPVGFDAYNVALKDVAFYAPREIYRNQRTVDNARALRQLGSDRLHQQMVEQQYRR